MARSWSQQELVGARNDANRVFSIPNLPGGTVTLWIYANGVLQYEVGAPPSVDEVNRSGSVITFGFSPSANTLLWVVIGAEEPPAGGGLDLIIASASAGAAAVYLNDLRESFYFNVFIRDKQGNLKEIIEKDITAISWSYSPIGGCTEAQITLRRPFDQHGDIQRDYEVEIWRDVDQLGQAGARLPAQFTSQGIQLGTSQVGTRELRWSGYVFEKQPQLLPDAGGQLGEVVVLRCLGWGRRLNRLVVNNLSAYSGQDVGAIVRDVIDNYVLAGSKIKRTGAFDLVQDTGVVVDSLEFHSYAANAFQTLASIGGNCEWGVRADKEFYFMPQQNAVKQTHAIGGRVMLYMPLESSDDEVHRVYLQGGDGILRILDGAPYQAGNQKELLANVGAVKSNSDATLWGVGFFANHSPANISPSGRLQTGGGADWIENVGLPIGLLRVVGGPVFAAGGDRLQSLLPFKLANVYGEYTNQSFRIQQITYTPESDALKADITLGARGAEIADLLTSIEFKLGEINQSLAQ